jgi:hypothetical protein
METLKMIINLTWCIQEGPDGVGSCGSAETQDAPGIGSGSATAAETEAEAVVKTDAEAEDEDDVSEEGASLANLVRMASLMGEASR